MVYAVIVLAVVCAALAALYIKHILAIRDITKQMEDIEKKNMRKCTLHAPIVDKDMDRLVARINDIYRDRDYERAVYLKKDSDIRKEIENISHDLRTPLTSIIGYVGLLQDMDNMTEEEKKYLNIIRNRSKVLQEFIEDFYELSRIGSNNVAMEPERINLQALISETAIAYYQQFSEKNIDVDIRLEDEPVCIIADKSMVNRIVNNIIQNALKYTQKTFNIDMVPKGDRHLITFKNDALGITKENVEHVFERFYIADKTRGSQSTGLGLTIAKALSDKIGAKISAHMDDDEFVIELEIG